VDAPRVAESRRWRVLWVHHAAEELRIHDRATIPEMTSRHVIVDLLPSGQVAQLNVGWLVAWQPDSRPPLQRFWGTVGQEGEAAYRALFIKAMCLRETDPVTVPCTALLLSAPIMDSVIVSTALNPAEHIDGIRRLSSRERRTQ
jgi:hypothetical protein